MRACLRIHIEEQLVHAADTEGAQSKRSGENRRYARRVLRRQVREAIEAEPRADVVACIVELLGPAPALPRCAVHKRHPRACVRAGE